MTDGDPVPSTEGRHCVLLVDDEPALLEVYELWLRERYDVRTARDGARALDRLDDDVDVAFVDRMMPGISGDEFVERIRREGYDCRVAMLTALKPTVDVLELGFDDYLVKPIRRDGLLEAADRLAVRSTYDDLMQEYFSLASKAAAVEAEVAPGRLEDSDDYRRLQSRLTSVRRALVESMDRFRDAREFEAAFEDLTTGRAP
ncbi:MAG: response regulator [Salinigranum sp.]